VTAEEAFHARNQPRFVGRGEEKRQLTRLVGHARQSRGGAALVTGEAGVGKTRLLLEVADQRRSQETILLRGHAGPGPAQTVLAQVVDSLRGARLEPERRVWKALEGRGRWLSAVLPELGGDPQPPGLHAPELVFQSLLEAVLEAAAESPAVWLLDDMQWADEATWSFLRYANRRLARSRLAILAACRDDELGLGHPAEAEMVSLLRDAGVLRVHLERLSKPETERLVRSLSGPRLTADAVSTVVERSAGNPRAAVDLAAAALANDVRSVPASISLTVDQRAATLGAEARDLLEVIAVMGVETDLELVVRLRAAAELPLGQLAESGLLIIRGAPPHLKVCFRHPLFRDAVYERTVWTRRRLLHAEVADALEESSGKDGPEAMADAAHHRELSGDGEGAVRALRAAAEAARAAFDVRRAGDLYLAALGAATRDPRLAHHRPPLIWAAIEQLSAAGRWADLLPLAWEAWSLPLESMSVPGMERSRILGVALLMMGRVDEGYGLLVAEADHLEGSGEASTAPRLLVTAAAAATYLGDQATSRRLSDLAASSGPNQIDSLAECVNIAQRFQRYRRRESAARGFHAAGVRALRQGMVSEAAVAFWNHARMTTQIRDVLHAESVGERARSMIAVLSRLLLGSIHTLEGRPAHAARILGQVDSEVRAVAPLMAPLLDGLRAQLHLQQGDLTRARRILKRWEGDHSELRSAPLTVLQAARGWLAWESGQLEEAAERLKRCAQDSATTGYGLFESGPLLLPMHVDALLRLGRDEEAERLIDETVKGADFDRFFTAAVAAASFRRRPSGPGGTEAQRAAAAAPWPFLEAVVEAWRAQLVGDVDEEPGARTRFRVTPAPTGDATAATSIEVPDIAAAQSPDEPPVKMSRRELQIANLIAEGLTNRAIAAQLVLSPETVSTHVKHILAKLGFSSRAQVAAWLSEQRARSQETETLLRFSAQKIPQMGDSRPG
jgi:DNA-binding CsgD family transcriptional regulator